MSSPGGDVGFVEYDWFDADPDDPSVYYQRLLKRRQQILSLDCNARGRMQQEWISLIVEMDAVMRVCHAHLGTVNFTRPRGRSFRGESFMVAPPTQQASLEASGARSALARPSDGGRSTERVAIGYIRLPVSAEATKSARGQTLQPPVVLRQFWRHPSWPDPDQTFIWTPHQVGPAGGNGDGADDDANEAQEGVPATPRVSIENDSASNKAKPRKSKGNGSKGVTSSKQRAARSSSSSSSSSRPLSVPSHVLKRDKRSSKSSAGPSSRSSSSGLASAGPRHSGSSLSAAAPVSSRSITPTQASASPKCGSPSVAARQLLPSVTVDL